MSLFYDSNLKPKLIENRLVKKIVHEQNENTNLDYKIKNYLFDFLKKNYLVILIILILIISLFWRYNEIKKKRNKNIQDDDEEYDEDSEIITTED
jgi:hypothetical protein